MSRASEILAYTDNIINGVEFDVDEVARKRRVEYRRKPGQASGSGKRRVRYTCGPGYRYTDGKCKRIPQSTRMKKRRSMIRAQRRLRSKQHMINRKRQRTMNRRRSAGY